MHLLHGGTQRRTNLRLSATEYQILRVRFSKNAQEDIYIGISLEDGTKIIRFIPICLMFLGFRLLIPKTSPYINIPSGLLVVMKSSWEGNAIDS